MLWVRRARQVERKLHIINSLFILHVKLIPELIFFRYFFNLDREVDAKFYQNILSSSSDFVYWIIGKWLILIARIAFLSRQGTSSNWHFLSNMISLMALIEYISIVISTRFFYGYFVRISNFEGRLNGSMKNFINPLFFLLSIFFSMANFHWMKFLAHF